MCNLTLRRFRVTIVVVEKKCVAYSDCMFVAICIQHAMHMQPIILSSVTCSTVQ
jgi:hypothetical protein